MKNTKGFGLYGLLAVLAIVLLVGFTVWRVTDKKENTSQQTTTTTQQTTESPKTGGIDPVPETQSYTDPTYKYTVTFPKGWVRQTVSTDRCSEGLVLLAPTPAELGACASENGGRVMVSADKDNNDNAYALEKAYYPDVTETEVTASGVKGKKYTATVQPTENLGPGPEVGSVLVQYVYKKAGNVYAVMYVEEPGQSNVRAVVEQIATTGFSF